MILKNLAALALNIAQDTISEHSNELIIEDVWLLEGELYQKLANALCIGSPYHECTQAELRYLNQVPQLLCSIIILSMVYQHRIPSSDLLHLIQHRLIELS